MANDLILHLPENTELRSLSISSDATEYNELLQRVVCALVLSDSAQITIDGMTLTEMLSKVTTATISALSSRLTVIASALRDSLNQDSEDIDDLTISAQLAEGNCVRLNINIISNGEATTGEIYI